MPNLKLTDTQLIILSSASQRDDALAVLPEKLKGGAAKKVTAKLLHHGLLKEVRVKPGEPHWRVDDSEHPIGLKLTGSGPEVGERIVALTLAEPPGETTHWTGRAMAKAAGVSLSYVQRVWRAHGLQPHRIRTFKLSNDPQFAAKVRDYACLMRSCA